MVHRSIVTIALRCSMVKSSHERLKASGKGLAIRLLLAIGFYTTTHHSLKHFANHLTITELNPLTSQLEFISGCYTHTHTHIKEQSKVSLKVRNHKSGNKYCPPWLKKNIVVLIHKGLFFNARYAIIRLSSYKITFFFQFFCST